MNKHAPTTIAVNDSIRGITYVTKLFPGDVIAEEYIVPQPGDFTDPNYHTVTSLRFGDGNLIVQYGYIGSEPSVGICAANTQEEPGTIPSDKDIGLPLVELRFPNSEKARRVFEALTSTEEANTTPPSAPVGVETINAVAWIEGLELPEGFRVAEHLPGIWEYQFDIEDEADEDSDRMVSGASWNHPALAAIAAWGHAYDALAQQPAPARKVVEMRICEVARVILRPNQPYVFTVDPNCENCRHAAATGDYATPQPVPPAQDFDAGLLSELDEWLQHCPDPTKVPQWGVNKASRLLWRCRDALAAAAKEVGRE